MLIQRIRLLVFVFIIFTAAWPAAAQDKPAGKPPVLRRGSSHSAPANAKAASQLAASIDAGDAYPAPDGPRKLLRLADAIAISSDSESPQFREQLLAADKPLSGYKVSGRRAHGVTILLAPSSGKGKQLKAAALDGLIQSVRATAAGKSANPVFIDPASGLRLLATSELIVCLMPGVDAKTYFGAQWKDTRPLWGTTDQFVLTMTNATAEEVFAAVSRHAAQPLVEWAEPNFILQAAKSFTPNDNFFVDQWHLQNTGQLGGAPGADVRATAAWDISLGNTNVVIAIIDDGVQWNHPDLAANIFTNPGEIPGNGIDDDGNGFIDDVHGWDFYAKDNDPSPADPLDNHGTALAGVAAGVGSNGLGISGVAPRCKILPLKIIKGDDGIPVTDVSQVLRYAAGLNSLGQHVWRGADVINISLGFPRSAAVDAALTTASTLGRNGRGCAIFCASGNAAGAWVPFEVEFEAPGTYTLRWEFLKDYSDYYSIGADTVWLDNLVFPDGTVESFEGGALPLGWTTGGDAPWHVVTNGVGGNRALTGWNGPGSHSLRAGRITHNQSNWVEVTTHIDQGLLRFWAWTESEAGDVDGQFMGFDLFHFIVVGTDVEDFDYGVPILRSGVTYPASHPATFGVGASTDFDFRSDYSQFGAELDFVAPSDGGNASITTTDRTGSDGYNETNGLAGDYAHDFGGTSSATPLASGIAALVLSVNPYLSLADLRALLRGTCDHIGNVFYDVNGFNVAYGYGRLNAEQAVRRARPNLIVTAAASHNPVVIGDITTYTISVRNNGSSLSGPVSVTNRLPANVILGPVTPAPSARIGNDLIFHADNMPSGALRTYRIVVTNTATGDNVNIASVGNDVQESALTDNSVTIMTTVVPVPFVSINDNVTVLEADATATNAVFQVTLSNPSSRIVTVRYATATNTALSGRDFAAVSGLLTFLPGQTMKTVTVRVLPDRLDENDETFFLNLNTPVNAILAVAQRVGTILDNDPFPTLSVGNVLRTEGDTSSSAAVFKVRLIPASGRPVTVQFGTASGSAIDGVDFTGTNGTLTFLPGKTLLSVPVRVFGERSRETNETFFLDLNNATFATISNSHGVCTIVNNDALPKLFISDASVIEGDSGTTNAVFNVRLAPASGIPAQVNFFTTNGSAGALDFTATNGVLVFAPGETNKTITVSVLGDTLSESNEVFSIRLVAPTNATLGDALGLGTILDDDPLPTLSISDASAVQALTFPTNAVFTVALSTVSGRTVTARYATSNGTAIASADYVARSGVLTFRPGMTSLMITTVVQRAVVGEIGESFFVNLSTPVNATLADGQGVGVILAAPPAALSPLRIVEARFERGTLRLRFNSEAGVRYCVECCGEPGGNGGWKPVTGAGEVSGTGGLIEAFDKEAGAVQKQFYRVRVLR
jgi:uncharacterized repeat protein (TIGR01451 family)